MKVGLLGTGFGIAHAHIYHAHPQVSEVVVFGRTPAKLRSFAEQFGFATTPRWPASTTTPPSTWSTSACPPGCTPSTSCGRFRPASTCSVSCPWPPPWPTPAASSTPRRPATGRSLWTCSAASTRPPSSCTPPSPRAATAPQDLGHRAAQRVVVGGLPDRPGLDRHGRPAQQPGHDRHRPGPARSMTTMGVAKDSGSSAAEVLLGYPGAIVRCSARPCCPSPMGCAAVTGRCSPRGPREQLDRRLRRPPHHYPDRVHRTRPARDRPARPGCLWVGDRARDRLLPGPGAST